MRVLFVTPYYPPAHEGGIERAIVQLATALRRVAPEVEPAVLTTDFTFPPRYVAGLPRFEERPEALVARWPCRPRATLPLFPWYSCPVTWFGPGPLRHLLAMLRPDVIDMVGDGWAWAHLWLLALRRQMPRPRPAVVFTPSCHPLTLDRQWLRLPNRLLCAQAERTIVLTSQERRMVGQVYHAPDARLRQVPWGTLTPAPLPMGEGWPKAGVRGRGEGLSIVCVGRVGPHKGQRWLLETYAQARPTFARPARLVFVGKDDAPGAGAALQAEAVRRGLGDAVQVLGEVSDDELAACYAEAGLFALFSRYEAFGLVYVEAMAHGVPVLTHRVGAAADLLTRGALLTAPFARDEAAAALIRLVNDDDLRDRLGTEARSLAAGMPTWEDCAQRTLAVFAEARAARRSP